MTETAVKAPPTMVVVSSAQHDAQVLAAEIAERKASGTELNRALQPGGKYMGTDGRYHDAHGNIIGGEDAPDVSDLSYEDAAKELAESEAKVAALRLRVDSARSEEQQKQADEQAKVREADAKKAAPATKKRR